MRSLRVLGLVLSVLISHGFAQTGTTSVRGTVVDKTGAAVVGAKVTITNKDQGLERETQTDNTGEYHFLALPPGTYSLIVEKEGFRRYDLLKLELLVNVAATSNVALVVGSTAENVDVSAQSETLNTTDASLGNAFSEVQVKELPLESRNVPDLLSLQAGVLYTGNRPDVDRSVDTRSGAVNGARSDQSNVTVDGIPANDKGGSAFTSVLPVTLDSVQEFRVTTTNYGADQGVSSAAQVALITKSGTNSFHGSIYEYNRNTYFSANDYFIKAAEIQNGDPNKPPQLNRNIFGVSVGGPILKDRLYFFLNYEGYRDAEAVSAERTIPTLAARNGVLQYLCADPSACTNVPSVPVNNITVTPPPGFMALSPDQITKMDSKSNSPQQGANPVVEQYMSSYPLPNDFTVGDGVNTAGYRFRAATHNTKNWYIAKLDYNLTANGQHRLSLAGYLANEGNPQAPFLPGTAPEQTFVNFNKGLIASYSAVFSPTLLNTFRYGFVRQSEGIEGNSQLAWNYLNFDQGVTRSSAFQRPIHNFTDDFTVARGKHTWQFGVQFAFLRNPASNQNSSFSAGFANQDWMLNSGISQVTNSDPMNPANPANGYPAVDTSFVSNYDAAATSLLGMITLGNAVYNYDRNGNTLAPGAPVVRRFAEDSYEMYAQDTWKAKKNLTVTLGLRYSLFSPPWETNGLQVGTTVNLGDWFNARGKGMLQGTPSSAQPLVAYQWAGPVNRQPGYYGWDKKNFGPKVAFAWSPDFPSGSWLEKLFGATGKSSIRGGFGMVYDRVGESLVDTFDQNGSFGLSTQLNNPSDFETSVTAPRLSSMNVIPQFDNAVPPQAILEPAPTGGFPQQFPVGLGAITWGIDPNLKTPYSYTLDFAISRELNSNFTLDVAYVGRMSHRLLAQDDLAMPLDIVDKQSGLDYFTAERGLAAVFRPQLLNGVSNPTQSFNSSQVSQKVQQFWTNQIQPITNGVPYQLSGCTGTDNSGNPILLPTTDPVVFAFDTFCATAFNDSLALYNLDYNGIPGYNSSQLYFTSGGQYSYYAPQFSSLYAWRSMAWSNYNGLQATLRHRMSHGVQFDLNYTWSKAIDISSDAERVGAASNGSLLGLNNNIINAWNPGAQKGVASFDATHQLNSNWVIEMPFGRGKLLAHDTGRAMEAVIGGWQFTGMFRWTSGFPVTVDNGFSAFPTNFEMEGNADKVGPVHTGVFLNTPAQGGGTNPNPNIFSNGVQAINSFSYAWAGESGQRNPIRGDGYFGIDIGIAKRWKMPWSESHSLQFRWEAFNVTNTAKFDAQSALLSDSLGLGSGSTFGNYSYLLTKPRLNEFALRYEF